MTNYLIPIFGLSALLLLHGCTTVPESKPQPATQPRAETIKPAEMEPPKAVAQPAVIYRATDTGFMWVTDTSDLQSRHRFRLDGRVIEVNSATSYYGGSVADINVGTRLRAVGFYRDDVTVADAIYFDRPDAPEEPATEAQPAQAGEAAARPPPKPSTAAAKQENSKVAAPPMVSPPSVKSSTRPSAAQVSSAETVRTKPPSENAREASLAKAGKHPPQPAPSGKETAKKALGSATGTGEAHDFSHLVFDNRILPMSLGHGWTLDRQPDVVDGTTRCVLLSPELPIFDGYYPAKVRLRVNPARAWVKTDSNIDASYHAQGLRVDGGALTPFAEKLANEQTAYTDTSVLDRMADGHTLTVALGFWPTWPKTKTQTASIDLAGFANAYAALQACSQQQQAAASGPASTESDARP